MNVMAKLAVGALLLGVSCSAFAQPYPEHRENRFERNHPHASRVCYMNGRMYGIGSVIRDRRHHTKEVCERVRGRPTWVRYHR